ncbi:carboxypeptidase-like regulatory domain-containing protein [Algibacter sp. 2305UL17-15]|uniref:carboxypeptidase-like regulatory domain-containing protein n=1 Tax=Algibacter sp. 2305UL17-15 TaxID=3231268 RepID=UPI003459FC93
MRHLFFLLLPFSMFAQNIKGKVYDNESTVKGIKVFNVSKKTKTYTDQDGSFTIAAAINDTLLFQSLFHHEKSVALKPNHFHDVAVFELKKMVNKLGDVLVIDEKSKEFNAVEYTEKTGLQLANDMKNNPHLYTNPPKYGLDFIQVASLIGKLFKKKDKPKIQPIEFITYKTLDSLFKKDKLFNLKLLNQDLKIPEEYAHLFLDYCDSKNLNKRLTSEENKVILLDSLFKFSREFLEITQEFEKPEDSFPLKN